MKKFDNLKSKFQQSNHRYLYLVILLLIAGSIQSQVCTPSPNSLSARDIQFNYYNTSATALSSSTVIESVGGPNYTVNVYTFTIPYFQNQLQSDLRYKNSVSSCTWNSGSSPCGSKTIKVYNSHSGGSVIGSAPNQVDIYNHNFPVGTSNIRVEASCGAQVYQTRYYRFIVQKEATPSVSLNLSAYCQKNNQGQNSGYIGFKATGTHSNSGKLYFRAVPPGGSSCSTTDFALNSLNTGSNPSGFYSCNSSGTYTVQLVYKSTLMGGGYISQVLNSNYYSYNKTFMSCMNVVDPGPISYFRTKEAVGPEISIHPNPANDQVQLDYQSKAAKVQVFINDMNSNPVTELSLDGQKGTQTIDIRSLKKGLYFITIVDGDKTFVKRIVKK